MSRYIHLNPVRAKIVARPEDWPWGSCPGYLRAKRKLDWITYGRVLGEFGKATAQSRREYRRFLQAGMDEPPASPFRDAVGGLLLGSQAFVDRVRRLLDEKPRDLDVPELGRMRPRPTLEAIKTVVAGHFEVDPADWVPGRRSNDAARAVAAYLARRRLGYPATAVAAALGYRDHGGVGRACRRIEQTTAELQRTLERLHKKLLNS